MTRDEYNKLFHKHQLNLVAFKMLNDCDEEVLRLVNAAIGAEREAIAQSLDKQADLAADEIDRQWAQEMAATIRARGNT